MALSALLLVALSGQELGGIVTKQVVTDLQTPNIVASPIRLALSPKLDGKIEEEEWDPFAGEGEHKAFLQWEPGVLHVGGVVPKDHDLVLSIDMNDDGWLRGKDNFEITASLQGEKVVLTTRQLDNTGKEGPTWQTVPSIVLGSKVVALTTGESTTYELSLADAGAGLLTFEKGRKFGTRYDVAPPNRPEPAAFLPRAMSEVTLGVERNAGMPTGLKVAIQDGFPTVTPGESTRIRLTFGGSKALTLDRLDLRSEGFARAYTASSSEPFPSFDKKGRTFQDYDTKVSAGAPFGYRLVRGTVTAADGIPGVVQGSYRIAPLIDFMLRTTEVKPSAVTRTVRLRYGVRSNSVSRVLGGVSVTLPEGWRNVSPEDRGYILNRKGFTADRGLDVEIPGGTKGTFPITFRSTLGDLSIEQSFWVIVR